MLRVYPYLLNFELMLSHETLETHGAKVFYYKEHLKRKEVMVNIACNMNKRLKFPRQKEICNEILSYFE